MSPRSRPLFDFGAGFLIGLSITVALFAAMEESGGRLSHDMLLTALATLVLAIVLKFAAKDRPRRRGGAPRARRLRDASALDPRWTAEGPPGTVTEAHTAGPSSKNYRASLEGRASAALPELEAIHRDAQASAADGETRRL